MNLSEIRFGVDFGGTKIELVALDRGGEIVYRQRVNTPRDDYPGSVKAVADLVFAAEAQLGKKGSVGVGIPGAVSPATGLVKNANSTWLIGQAFDQDLAQALDRPVRLANDANCFALSEASDGAGAGFNCVFGVILGTGVGGGLVIHGKILAGPNAIAGEWGHNPLPWADPVLDPAHRCYCGKFGCIETYLSGPALERVVDPRRSIKATELEASYGRDPKTDRILDRYYHQAARALASVINILDPDVIVIGGGLSNFQHFYQIVPKLWGQFTFSDEISTILRPNKHGDSSGVRGAAWLWP